MTTFRDLPIPEPIQQVLADNNFVTPTEIQKKTIPQLIENKRIDLHGQAQTGTGKTLAFGIPLIARIDPKKRETQSLVVAPTRELVIQICDSLNAICKPLKINVEPIYGGASIVNQIRNLKSHAQIVVGTPGRLIDHLRRQTLNAKSIETLVLDEADIMLDMGFKEEIDEILKFVPQERNIWLFSATVKPGIADIAKTHMHDPVSVRVSKAQVGSSTTKQYYCMVPSRSRLHALCRFIDCATDFYGFIFCQTKLLTAEVADKLTQKGYNVAALHGDMSQAQRNMVIKKFRDQEVNIVVATDVAARGIDVANLTHVINYSFPEDYESYVHRVGRTGRAGKEGIAITMINKHDLKTVKFVEKKFSITINPIEVPSTQTIINARIAQAGEYLSNLAEHTAHRPFMDEITKLINGMSSEDQQQALAALLYGKFLGTVEMQEIAPVTHYEDDRRQGGDRRQYQDKFAPEEGIVELCMNVGLDDRLTRDQVLDFIVQNAQVDPQQILKIRLIKRRTFMHVPQEIAKTIINSLNRKRFGGQTLRVNFAQSN